LGRKIRRKKIGDVLSVELADTVDDRNLDYYILDALSSGSLSYSQIQLRLNISHENARWRISRRAGGLEARGLVFSRTPPKQQKQWGLTRLGRAVLVELPKTVRRVKRRQLVVKTTSGSFVLSSWWSSWLCPKPSELFFDYSESRFVWRLPANVLYLFCLKEDGINCAVLPRFVEVDSELLLSAIGLLKGEMMLELGKLSFVNTEGRLVRMVLDCFESFGLQSGRWQFFIQLNTKNGDKCDAELRQHWSSLLGVSLSNAAVVRYPTYGSKRGDFGRVVIVYKNSLFRLLFDELMNYFIDAATRDSNYAAYFLRGLMAAEGWVSFKPWGPPGSLGIGSTSYESMREYSAVLAELGIHSGFGKKDVYVAGFDDFNKVNAADLLKLSKYKERFSASFLSYTYPLGKTRRPKKAFARGGECEKTEIGSQAEVEEVQAQKEAH